MNHQKGGFVRTQQTPPRSAPALYKEPHTNIQVQSTSGNLRRCVVHPLDNPQIQYSVCYADDLVLLAPSPSAPRIMLCCCVGFATNRSLRFNPSKTPLIRFSNSHPPLALLTFTSVVSFSPFPFLDTVSHFSHLLQRH